MKKAFIVIFFLLGNWPVPISAQLAQFQHFNEKYGLSQNSINALFQDSLGFLWIGTEEGLNRYDGKEFRVFRHLRNAPNSLTNSYIQSIFTGKNGKIWIGTQYGLNRYDPETERFERFINPDTNLVEGKNYVHKGTVDRNGLVWYGTYDGMFRLHPEKREWTHFPPDTSLPHGVSSNAVWSVHEDAKGDFWIGTSNGLNIARSNNPLKIERYYPDANDPWAIPSGRIFNITETLDGSVWLATGNGLGKASGEPGKLKFHQYKYDPSQTYSLSNDFLWDVVPDRNGGLWITSYGGGLNQLSSTNIDNSPLTFVRHLHDEKRPNSIAHDEVNCALLDRSGILWAGTAAGLDKIDPSGGRFALVQNVPNVPASLRSDHVQALLIDSHGDLWIGTRGGGLHRLKAERLAEGKFDFELFKKDSSNPHSLSHNDVFGISEDSHGYIWVSTYDGLNYFKPSGNGTPKFRQFNVGDGISSKFQFQVLQRKNGEYWVATYGRLNRMQFDPLRPANTTFVEYDMDLTRADALVNATTYTMVEDRFGQLWIGTFNGISKLVSSEGDGIFENYLHDPNDPLSLSNNFVKELYVDTRGRLWACTRSGLNFIEQKAKNEPVIFHSFGPADGLPSETIQTICEDGKGRFWIGTIGGLALFDPDIALKKNGESPVLQTFDYRDGLQGNEFSERSALRDQDGKMYFGGIHGLNIFDPEKLWENTYVPPVVFTQFRLFNKVVRPGSEKSPLEKSISHTSSITLKYWQNVIGFSFAALSFSQPSKNSYAYRMSGFDKDWISSGNENSATYTNLSPGNYRFEVKAANSDGLWTETPISISLNILPPWWLTWWAYLIYGVVLIGAVTAVIHLREKSIRRIEQAKVEEREHLRKQNAADFHDELGHRLTKISLFVELAERQKNDSNALSAHLSKVRRHAAGLSVGIRDLIWTLDSGSDSMLQTLVRLREFGDELFKRSGIIFTAEGIHEKLAQYPLGPAVRKHILLLFKEAMNNCLKYSRASQCHFLAKKTADGFQFELSDNGQGFDVDKSNRGYGLHNMKERAKKIGGVLHIKSIPGNGTSISLKIKMPQMG